MANDSHSWQTVDNPQPWHEIDELLEQIAKLSKSQVTMPEFYQSLLKSLTRVISSAGGVVWIQQPNRLFTPLAQIHLDQIFTGNHAQALEEHFQKYRNHFNKNGVQSLPFSVDGKSNHSENIRSDSVVLIAPIQLDDQVVGYLELFISDGLAPSAQQGYEELLTAVCDLAGDFHRNCSLKESKHREQLWSKIDQFACDVHADLDLRATSYTIANQASGIIGCDRVSVCQLDRNRARTLAISGVDKVQSRSNVVRLMQQLVEVVSQTQEILWYQEGTKSELPPQIQQAVDRYVDQSTSRTVVVIPLLKKSTSNSSSEKSSSESSPSQAIAALVVEWFQVTTDSAASSRIQTVCEHSKRALINAMEYQDIPLLPVLQWIKTMRWFVQARQLPKTILCLIFTAVVILALSVVPADFEIETQGQLQPLHRYDIFAPSDGIVLKLQISDPQVKKNQILAELMNTKQDVELKKVEGNLESAELSLLTVNQAITELTPEQKERKAELDSRKADLEARIDSYRLQKKLLIDQQKSFMIRSPLSGKVLTWDVVRKLTGRPVQRGQVLMTVADTTGPWILELWVSDKSIGHLLAEQKKQTEPLQIEFILASQPGKKLTGRLQATAISTELDPSGNAAVKVIIAIDHDQIKQPMPGKTAIAKINCGRRAIGYVWFHELWETIQTKLLF